LILKVAQCLLQDNYELQTGKPGIIDGEAPKHWRLRYGKQRVGAFHGLQVLLYYYRLNVVCPHICSALDLASATVESARYITKNRFEAWKS
jgi:hypothetical protein